MINDKKLFDTINNACNKINAGDASLIPITDTRFFVGMSTNGYKFSLWENSHISDFDTVNEIFIVIKNNGKKI